MSKVLITLMSDGECEQDTLRALLFVRYPQASVTPQGRRWLVETGRKHWTDVDARFMTRLVEEDNLLAGWANADRMFGE